MRYADHRTWPKIRDLSKTGVHHRFTEIPENDASHWNSPVLKRPVPPDDPRFSWGEMIREAHKQDSVLSMQQFRPAYPEDLKKALQDEQARIVARHVQATKDLIEESIQEQAALEVVEAPTEPDTRPDFIEEIQERKVKLLNVFGMVHRSKSHMKFENTSDGSKFFGPH
jgi:hypothetical protein